MTDRGAREGDEIEALVTDRYLDGLLAAHARGADERPSAHPPDDPIRRAAQRLARDLPRLHPSFRFEEALAQRLADIAARMRQPGVDLDGLIIPIPALDPTPDRLADDGFDQRRGAARRPVIVGGALTSVALSLAGAVYVAWRLNRPPSDPMARAVRAVAKGRLT